MHVSKVPKEVLDKIAGFPVCNLIYERHEVSLLGEDWDNVKSFNHKDFWRSYRAIKRSENAGVREREEVQTKDS